MTVTHEIMPREVRQTNSAEIVDRLFQQLEYHQTQLNKHQARADELMEWIARINKKGIEEHESRNS